MRCCSVLLSSAAQIVHLLLAKMERVSSRPPPLSFLLAEVSSPFLSVMKILTSSQERKRAGHRLFYVLSFYSSGDIRGGNENVKVVRDRSGAM